jgi:hypothetical protein
MEMARHMGGFTSRNSSVFYISGIINLRFAAFLAKQEKFPESKEHYKQGIVELKSCTTCQVESPEDVISVMKVLKIDFANIPME